MIQLSKRMQKNEYVFASITKRKNELIAEGKKVIDFGVGDCTEPTPKEIVEVLRESVLEPETHHYSYYNGTPDFRKSVSEWMKKRFNVDADYDSEITALIGSKEAIFRFPQTIINQNDLALIPEPSYPVYASGVIHAGGEVFYIPLHEKNLFLPDFSEIPENIKQRAKLIFINYPNNPTSAQADKCFFEKLFSEAEKYNWIITSDMAYSEIYNKNKPLSIFEFDKQKSRSIEFYSLSKSFNMTGWRIGYAVGNHQLIKALVTVKSEQGSSPFAPVQKAASFALLKGDSLIESIREYYRKQRKKMYLILDNAGIDYFKSDAGFYVFAKVPKGFTSFDWCKKIMEEKYIVTTPGSALGPSGEGYFRLTLTRTEEEMAEFAERIRNL